MSTVFVAALTIADATSITLRVVAKYNSLHGEKEECPKRKNGCLKRKLDLIT